VGEEREEMEERREGEKKGTSRDWSKREERKE